MSDWISIKDLSPPDDGTEILCCIDTHYQPVTAMLKTYRGHRCWRDSGGNKIVFTHWREQLGPPQTKSHE